MAYELIPNELKALKQWGLYKREWQETKQKFNKFPKSAIDGSDAKSNDPTTWVDFETALKALDEFKLDGLGFFFANGYAGIDIDHVAVDLHRWRQGDDDDNVVSDFLSHTESYAETSMSGEGLHIIVKGEIPGDRRRKGNIEMYQAGRFFAMTGKRTGNFKRINEIKPSNFKYLYEKYLGRDKVLQLPTNQPTQTVNLSEQEIIDKASKSKTGKRFLLLYGGGWEQFYSSQSEADLAFANDLAFWTGRDFSKMDSIFRQSSLMRDKWDEKHGKTTYGVATLNKAINENTAVYEPQRELPKYDLKFLTNGHKELPARSWDDSGLVDRFLDHFGDKVRYSYIDNCFYIFNGSYWEADNSGKVHSLLDEIVKNMKNEKVVAPPEVDKEKIEEAWAKFLKSARNNKTKTAVMKEMQHRIPVMPDEFDKDKMLLNASNGYVNLASGKLENHSIIKMFSREASVEYSDTVDAPEWEAFLKQVFDNDLDLINYIQKAVGYSLTGSTKEQVMFILFGNGRNGKSIFLETISNVLGSYAKTIQASSIMVKQNASGPNSDIARLKGARLVTSSEPNEGLRMDEGLVKQLTGGDKVTARKLYGQEFEFEPEFKLWLATNHKPIIRGTDDGIWRRLILVPFSVQIPDHKVDKDLKYKLQREATGIMNWAVDGCLKWQTEGLGLPKVIKDASTGYRAEMDVISQFVSDCCETAPGFEVKASEIYKVYKQWADDNSEYCMSNTKFGREMQQKFTRKHTKFGNTYEGLSIKIDSRLNFMK